MGMESLLALYLRGVIGLKETLLPSLGPPPLVLEGGVKQGHYEHHFLVNTGLDMAKRGYPLEYTLLRYHE